MLFKLTSGKTLSQSAYPARKESVGSVPPPAASDSAQHVNANEAQKLGSEKKALVLDVRTPDEFASGHIPGPVNIDFRAGDFGQKIAALDKTAAYLVHCASGNRSRQSLPLFEKQGFLHLYHLDGGFHAWENAGWPIEK